MYNISEYVTRLRDHDEVILLELDIFKSVPTQSMAQIDCMHILCFLQKYQQSCDRFLCYVWFSDLPKNKEQSERLTSEQIISKHFRNFQ